MYFTGEVFRGELAGRPAHGASSEEVHMQMVDGLAAIFAGADHGAIPVAQAFGAGDFRRDKKQVAEERLVVFGGMSERGDVLPRDDQHMRGGLGIDVEEGITLVVLVDGGRRNGAGGDAAKKAVHSGNSVQGTGNREQGTVSSGRGRETGNRE